MNHSWTLALESYEIVFSLVDGVDRGHESVVLSTLVIVVVDITAVLNNRHCLFVHALEKQNCQGCSTVGKEEEDPGAFCLIEIALENYPEHESQSGSRVVRRASHDALNLAHANNGSIGGGDDQGGDGGVA